MYRISYLQEALKHIEDENHAEEKAPHFDRRTVAFGRKIDYCLPEPHGKYRIEVLPMKRKVKPHLAPIETESTQSKHPRNLTASASKTSFSSSDSMEFGTFASAGQQKEQSLLKAITGQKSLQSQTSSNRLLDRKELPESQPRHLAAADKRSNEKLHRGMPSQMLGSVPTQKERNVVSSAVGYTPDEQLSPVTAFRKLVLDPIVRPQEELPLYVTPAIERTAGSEVCAEASIGTLEEKLNLKRTDSSENICIIQTGETPVETQEPSTDDESSAAPPAKVKFEIDLQLEATRVTVDEEHGPSDSRHSEPELKEDKPSSMPANYDSIYQSNDIARGDTSGVNLNTSIDTSPTYRTFHESMHTVAPAAEHGRPNASMGDAYGKQQTLGINLDFQMDGWTTHEKRNWTEYIPDSSRLVYSPSENGEHGHSVGIFPSAIPVLPPISLKSNAIAMAAAPTSPERLYDEIQEPKQPSRASSSASMHSDAIVIYDESLQPYRLH